jgi:hypothetical protein
VKETYQKQLAILASFEQQLEPVQILVASNLDGSAVVLTERDFGECRNILKSLHMLYNDIFLQEIEDN